jgi:hypothetical protein
MINYCEIKPTWKGETVYILGGGPSLLDEDLSLIHNKPVIGVNDAFKLGDWVDVSWSTDCQWLDWNKDALSEFSGVIYSTPPCKCDHPGIIRIKRRNMVGISSNPSVVYWNKSSGASAINLAYLLGASKIVLLGFDMKMRGDRHNWHSNHKNTPQPAVYKNVFLKPFEQVAIDAHLRKIKIINATNDTDLTVFQRMPLKEVVEL